MAKPQANGKATIPPGTAFYSPKQMATLLAVSTETIRRMVADGRLTPPVYFGQRLPRWHRATIDAWIARGCPLPVEHEERIHAARARAARTRKANDAARQQRVKDILDDLDREGRAMMAEAKEKEEQPCPA